jgi:streptomycin 6-kinase
MAHVAKRFIIPEDLARAATKEGREEWLAKLPALVAWATASWQIEVADPFHPGGETAWVAPARDHTGKGSVLKVCWPHPEAAHEAEGLRSWGGAGAVRLYRANKASPYWPGTADLARTLAPS